MLEVPSTDWGDALPPLKTALRAAPVRGEWWQVPGTVGHVFTHFRLQMEVYRALVPANASLTLWCDPGRCRWVPRGELVTRCIADRNAQDTGARAARHVTVAGSASERARNCSATTVATAAPYGRNCSADARS